MTLSAGTQLGSFEIVGQLGVGGMGEVYRATDTKLGRDVAIKTLPAALAQDKDRLARFEREAKLLASLHHAHIASVFSLDEHDGTLYIAMELVEGMTLEDKLKAGAIPVADALQLGLQIALALEAAHEKGVVHRDVKPANIMITPDDVVKVLDFGLAKAFSGNPNEASVLHSPALSAAMTQEGLVLGTAGYMSPEQASGQATDQRADIWAFGVVLYEMLTGQPVFSGESVPHILADVLRTDPDWTRLPAHLHPRLRLLLTRCLDKSLRSRYHSIADARADIESVLNDPDGAASMLATAALPRGQSALPRLVASVMLTGAIAGVIAWTYWPVPETTPVNRFEIPLGHQLRSTSNSTLALSPDGRRFAYNTTDGLYLYEMSELEPRLIPGTERQLFDPMFTPDGDEIVYVHPDALGFALSRISIAGGVSTMIVPAEHFEEAMPRPASAIWTPDRKLLFSHDGGISRIATIAGSEPELLIDVGTDRATSDAQFLPDGDTILYAVRGATEGLVNSKIVARRLSDPESEHELVTRGHEPRYWATTGHLLYVLDDVVYAVALNVDELETYGDAEPVLSDVRLGTAFAEAEYEVAEDGTLIYFPRGNSGDSAAGLAWFYEDGRVERLPFDQSSPLNPKLSPDGTKIAISAVVEPGNQDIVVYHLDRPGNFIRVTRGLSSDSRPMWTPDGDSLVFFSGRDGGGLYRMTANATGDPSLVSRRPQGTRGALVPNWIDAERQELVFSVGDLSTAGIYRVSLEGEEDPVMLIDDPEYREMQPALSPDGRWLVYVSEETGTPELFISPYPNVTDDKERVSASGGLEPVWDDTSGLLYYVAPDLQLMRVDVQTSPTLDIGDSDRVPVGPFLFDALQVTRNYDVDRQGQRFLMRYGEGVTSDSARIDSIVIVQNWDEVLKRLVPAN